MKLSNDLTQPDAFDVELEMRRIKRLSEANGPSGFEDEVVSVLRENLSPLDLQEDTLRNLYAPHPGNEGGRPHVMLDAHTDEVGFIVQSIQANGMLRLLPLGSWVLHNVPAHSVRVRNDGGCWIEGTIASKPPHFMTEAERSQPLTWEQLVVDIGAQSADEVKELFHVSMAAPVVPDVRFTEIQDKPGWFRGKAFDCRIGVAAGAATLEAVAGRELEVDVTAVFTTQEEVGGRGAAVAARRVKPDVCIVFEGCPADDTFSSPPESQTAVGKGPMLRHLDRTMITSPRFQRLALDTARELGIPVQEAVRSGGGTNGGLIHQSGLGIPCIVIGIPVRYAHTHYGVSCLDDYSSAIRLAILTTDCILSSIARV